MNLRAPAMARDAMLAVGRLSLNGETCVKTTGDGEAHFEHLAFVGGRPGSVILRFAVMRPDPEYAEGGNYPGGAGFDHPGDPCEPTLGVFAASARRTRSSGAARLRPAARPSV